MGVLLSKLGGVTWTYSRLLVDVGFHEDPANKGISTPRGFTELFKQALKAQDFPLEIARVRLAQDTFGAVARGALVAAQAENGGAEVESVEKRSDWNEN